MEARAKLCACCDRCQQDKLETVFFSVTVGKGTSCMKRISVIAAITFSAEIRRVRSWHKNVSEFDTENFAKINQCPHSFPALPSSPMRPYACPCIPNQSSNKPSLTKDSHGKSSSPKSLVDLEARIGSPTFDSPHTESTPSKIGRAWTQLRSSSRPRLLLQGPPPLHHARLLVQRPSV